MLETHFVWTRFRSCLVEFHDLRLLRRAHSAALHGDASGADVRSSDVDYAGLPSLIGGIESSGRSGSLRSLQWCIVIGRSQKLITRNRSVCDFFTFFLLAVSRGVLARTPRSHPEHYLYRKLAVAMELHPVTPFRA